ncbi:MAG: cytochrome P450, partial [Solirubrobacterales bacterium]
LGAAFAEFEMGIVLEEVLRRCELAPITGRPQKVGRRNITLSPKQGTPVTLISRQPAREPAPAPAPA